MFQQREPLTLIMLLANNERSTKYTLVSIYRTESFFWPAGLYQLIAYYVTVDKWEKNIIICSFVKSVANFDSICVIKQSCVCLITQDVYSLH